MKIQQAPSIADINAIAKSKNPNDRPFPLMGITLEGIQKFIEEIGGKSKISDLTTNDICQRYILPMTKSYNCSYCDFMILNGNENENVNLANVFISHTWKNNFLDLIDALENFKFTKPGKKDEKTYLWIDLFSNNQNDLGDPPAFEWWCETFKGAISAISTVVMVISPWDNPVPLKRAWCLWEVYCAIETNSNFAVTMCSREQARFDSMIVENSDRFLDMLGNIDLRTSEATNPVDKERIFLVVEKTVGLATLNIKVAEVMKAWVERRLHSLSRIGWDWSDIPQFLGGELNFFSNKDDAADHSFKITEDKISYCLSYASILITNGKYTIAEREIGRIKSAINSAEWAEKSQLEGEAKIVEAKLLLHTNENRTPEKFTPILFRKLIPMFKTADINRTMELFSEGIAIFDKLLNDVESGSSRSDKLISLYLKSYDGKCAVLLKSRDLKEDVVLEYYEKAVKLTGEESLETAVAMATKASFYQHNNNPIKAIEFYEKALRNYRFFLSDSHPTTIRLSFQIAMIYNELAKFAYHQKLLEEVYYKTLEKFPPKSEFTNKVGTSYFIASTLTCRWYTMYKYQKSTMKLFLFNEIEPVWKTFRNQKLTIRNCLAKFVVCICLFILLMIALLMNVGIVFYFLLLFLQLAPLIIMRASLHKLLSLCLTPTCLVRVMYGRRGKSIVLQFIFTFTFPIVMFLAFVIAFPIALLFQIIKACGSSLARIK